MATSLLSLLTFLPLAGALVLLILPEKEKSKIRWLRPDRQPGNFPGFVARSNSI